MDALNDTGLDTGTGEPQCLLLGPDGDFAFIGGSLVRARGTPALLQRVRVAVLLWLGEWFLDVSAGTDWRQVFEAKPPDPERAQGLLRTRILSVAGVRSVDSVSVSFDSAERRLSLSYTATGESGEALADTLVR